MKRLFLLVCLIMIGESAKGICLGSNERLFLKNLSKRRKANHYDLKLKRPRQYIKETKLNFEPNIEALKKGAVQYSLQNFTDKEIGQFLKTGLGNLDFHGFSKMKKMALAVSKFLLVLPNQRPKVFTLKKVTALEYLKKVIPDLKRVRVKMDTDECPTGNTELTTIVKVGPIKLGEMTFKSQSKSLNLENLKFPDGNIRALNQLEAIFSPSYENVLGIPQRVQVEIMAPIKKVFNGVTLVGKYYSWGDKHTLAVTYSIMGVRVKELPYLPWKVLKLALRKEMFKRIQFMGNNFL